VTIALLDTGVDRAHPFLRGRLRGESTSSAATPERSPRRSRTSLATLEQHGRRWRVSSSAPAGREALRRRRAGASLLSIRVAGWQRDAARSGRVRRTDQILAGLERAVARTGGRRRPRRLPGSRWSHFASRSPPSRIRPSHGRRAGALRLDTLVVVPAGNDGPAGPGYGMRVGAGRRAGGADGRRAGSPARYGRYGSFSVRASRWRSTRTRPLAGAVEPQSPIERRRGRPAGANDRGWKAAQRRSAARLLRPPRLQSRGRRGQALVPVTSDPALTVANAAARRVRPPRFSTEVAAPCVCDRTTSTGARARRSSREHTRGSSLP